METPFLNTSYSRSNVPSSGRPPAGSFIGRRVADVRIARLRLPPPIIPNSPQALQLIVDRSLAKEPAARFSRAGDLAGAFGKAISTPEGRKR